MYSLKIVLIGDAGVGKSTFLKRHRTGEFDRKYIATMGVDVVPLTFYTTHGKITFKILDCAGNANFAGLDTGYYHQAHGVICMYDLASEITYKSVPGWIEKVRNIVPNIPIVICGNKSDLTATPYSGFGATTCSGTKRIITSARNCYGFGKPFLELARMILGENELKFVDAPLLTPPTIQPIPPVIEPSNTFPKYEKTVTHWITSPGYRIKVTHEFYRDEEL